MSKRVRRTGPDTTVQWPPEAPTNSYLVEYSENVESGHMLSTDAPAKLRDQLLKMDGWSEVQESSASSSSEKAPAKEDDK